MKHNSARGANTMEFPSIGKFARPARGAITMVKTIVQDGVFNLERALLLLIYKLFA